MELRKTSIGKPSHDVWVVTYKDVTLRKEIAKPSRFAQAELVRRLYERADEVRNLEAENLLELGLRGGRGGFWIRLTVDEYGSLCATRAGAR